MFMNLAPRSGNPQRPWSVLRLAMVCSLAFGAGTAAAQEPHGVTMDQIVAAWRARQDRVKTARFEMDEQYTTGKGTQAGKAMLAPQYRGPDADPSRVLPPHETTHELQTVVVFSPDKLRYERRGPQWWGATEEFVTLEYTSIFDGEASISHYKTPNNTNNIRSLGFVSRDGIHSDRGSVSIRPVLTHYRGLLSSMSQFDPAVWIVEADVQTVERRPCVVVARRDGAHTYRYWLDVQRDFALMRYTREFKGFTSMQLDVAYTHDTQVGWVPERWQFAERDRDGKLRSAGIVVVTRYELSIGLPAETFQFEFPIGTEVTDYDKAEPYIVMPKAETREITAAERDRGATYEELLATRKGEARLVRARGGGWGWYVVWGFPVVVVAAVVLLFFWRRRR